MTVATTTARSSQNGDGVSVAFTVPFPFLANADLKVYVGGVLKTLTTDYSVTGAGGSSGTLTFVSAPAVGTGNVVIIRDPDLLQQTAYPSNDTFPSKVTETAFDKLTMVGQRSRDLISRAFVLADSDTSGASLTVPTPQANYLLGWNSSGTGLSNYASTGGTGTLPLPVSVANGGTNAATAAAARTNLGAAASGAATASGLTQSTGKLLGRTTASSGAIEEIGTGQGLTLAATSLAAILQRSYLSGLVMSTAGGSATMSIAAGMAVDSTNAVLMQGAASSKTTSAWAVGSATGGKLNAAAIANNTWYAWFIIYRSDTGVVDYGFDTAANASSPTLPTSYTHWRRIGWGRTDGAATWVKFVQDGERWWWDVPVLDLSAAIGVARAAQALLVPPSTRAVFTLSAVDPGTAAFQAVMLTETGQTDTAPNVNGLHSLRYGSGAATASTGSAEFQLKADSSSQINIRGTAAHTCYITTKGWIDTRGRDA